MPSASVPVTGLVQQVRSGGAYDSASVVLPALDPVTGQPYKRFVVQGVMSDTDAKNPANSCRVTVSASWDGGLNFSATGAVYNWQGGLSPKDGSFTVPSETFPLPVNAQGKLPDAMRINFDTLGSSLNAGIQLSYDTP
jgi:hypothetical protein